MNDIQFVKYLCKDALDTYQNEVPDEVLAAIGKAVLEVYKEEYDEDD